MVEDLKDYAAGTQHDELKWNEVSVHACKILNASEKVVFTTPDEMMNKGDMVTYAKDDGLSVVTVPDVISRKIHNAADVSGNPIRDLKHYTIEYNASYEYKFVKPAELSAEERAVYSKTKEIFGLIGGRPGSVREVLISETMRKENTGADAAGVWEGDGGKIIIKRTTLTSVSSYAGTLLHEAAHAISGASDMTIDFELELTGIIGKISAKSL